MWWKPKAHRDQPCSHLDRQNGNMKRESKHQIKKYNSSTPVMSRSIYMLIYLLSERMKKKSRKSRSEIARSFHAKLLCIQCASHLHLSSKILPLKLKLKLYIHYYCLMFRFFFLRFARSRHLFSSHALHRLNCVDKIFFRFVCLFIFHFH